MAGVVETALILRCPVCTAEQKAPKGTEEGTWVLCVSCRHGFDALRSRLGVESIKGLRGQTLREATLDYSPAQWIGTAAVALGATIVATVMGYDMRGPDFILFYFCVFVTTLLTMHVLRRTWRDHLAVTCAALAVFEGIGLLRIVTGLPRGMTRYGFLLFMMLFGSVAYVIRAKHLEGMTSGGSGDGSCGGSSCSGGGGGCGGGGGGCGGCGG
jgi:uncharacterized membrane protein YgcG